MQEMLGKLSLRNAKRQAKDYVIYFMTIVMAVALLFSFNSIAASSDIAELSSSMKSFSKAIMGINLVVVFVMVWLIHYTMKFMLEKRSKEFGTYQILGIEKKDIANIFIAENLLIGMIAFVVGSVVGTFMYQIFTSIIMNLFAQPYQISIAFSWEAVKTTALCFFGIFALVLFKVRRKIKKTKVHDLLYAEKQNENNHIQNAKGNVILFMISVILLLGGLWVLNLDYSNPVQMTGKNTTITIVLWIVAIYMFYLSISSFIVKRYLENRTRKYKKNNLFLYRNLTSKINTMSATLGTIAVLFAFIMVGGNVALLMNGMMNNEIEMGYPFEIMVSSVDGDFSKYKEYIQKNAKVLDMYEYRLYNIPKTNLEKGLDGTTFQDRYDMGYENVLGLTDYNHLRKMLGYDIISLEENEAIIQCMKTAEKPFEDYIQKNNKIEIAEKQMTVKDVQGDHFAQISFNGYVYCIVVPDSLLEEIAALDFEVEEYYPDDYKLVATTQETTTEEFYQGLSDYILYDEVENTAEIDGKEQTYKINIPLGNVMTKGNRTSQVKSFYTMISFLAFYVALIFVMATATILAIQQLSDSEKYKYRYELLKKLGMDESEMNQTILKQILFYFALPMLIPILLSIPAVFIVAQIFTVAVTIEEIWRNMALVIGIFIFVYGIYFVATNIQFDRNINGSR